MTGVRERVILAGAGGHASELRQYLETMRRAGWPVEYVGCLDDTLPPGPHPQRRGLVLLGPMEAAGQFPNEQILTAIGCNSGRRMVVERLWRTGVEGRFWTLRHPAATIGDDVEIGEGTCVAPGAILTARTRVGRHCIINVKASVSHDCEIGDFACLNPGATICGHVLVGAGAYIGAGATVIDRMRVGAGSIIGAGAVVISDIPDRATAVGVPARVIRTH